VVIRPLNQILVVSFHVHVHFNCSRHHITAGLCECLARVRPAASYDGTDNNASLSSNLRPPLHAASESPPIFVPNGPMHEPSPHRDAVAQTLRCAASQASRDVNPAALMHTHTVDRRIHEKQEEANENVPHNRCARVDGTDLLVHIVV
jgi:hypothetical protein